ncbi:MAG TPA: glycine--tRNA ligase subunit beta, partial [Anaerolineales bacterium]|nr:glycine--tRNA ligase subunit beta [Anaerolineales bacterium]
LSPTQPDREEVVKGPPADKAIVRQTSSSSAGQTGSLTYTPAAQGFAKKNGINVEDLQVREQDGGKYVFAVVKQKGRPTPEVLAEALPKLIAEIKFEKSMRWNDSGVSFSRPIRWYVALLGDMVIPFEYAGVVSGNVSRGLRPYDSPEIKIPSADKYFDAMREAGIVLDKEERKNSIIEHVNQAASLVGGEALLEDGLLNEVANLVEMPTAVMGSFNKEFLALPRDVLISVMKKHQRYFPVQKSSKSNDQPEMWNVEHGTLLPHFIAIRNGDDIGIDAVRKGNEHVLNARFADANFFVREDLKHTLEEFRSKLAALTFHAKLGSMLDKSNRILKLGAEVGARLGFKDADEIKTLARAAYLMKADLATQMVTEMTSLQGIIGGEYALRGGESQETARAIAEQYQTVPQSKFGLAIALADRLDSLVGLFAAGLAPTGTKDPFGLRRAAIGLVQPLIEHKVQFNLSDAIQKSAQLQPIEVSAETQAQVLDFITGRLSVVLKETGYKHDAVEAILAEQSENPAACVWSLNQLSEWTSRDDWQTILAAFARCARITRDQKQIFPIDEKLLVEKEEKDLFAEVKIISSQPFSVQGFLKMIVKLTPAINAFFDKVLVMAEDEAVKKNRLGLLQKIVSKSKGVADFSKLDGF